MKKLLILALLLCQCSSPSIENVDDPESVADVSEEIVEEKPKGPTPAKYIRRKYFKFLPPIHDLDKIEKEYPHVVDLPDFPFKLRIPQFWAYSFAEDETLIISEDDDILVSFFPYDGYINFPSNVQIVHSKINDQITSFCSRSHCIIYHLEHGFFLAYAAGEEAYEALRYLY